MQWSWPRGATKANWLAILGIGVVMLVWGMLAGFKFSAAYFVPVWVALVLLRGAGYLEARGTWPRVTASLAVLAWLLAGAPIVSHACYVMTSANFPLYDSLYARLDEAMGIDVIGLIRATGQDAWFAVMSLNIYQQFVIQAMLGYAVLIATKQFDRLADTLGIMTIGMVTTLVMSTLFPALGIAGHYAIAASDFGHLGGSGATAWHLEHYLGLRDGTMRAFPEPEKWQGLVTFPSFHVVHTLAAAYAVSNIRWLAWPSGIFTGFMIFTAIPIGGHYFVDLVAGFGIYMAALWYVSWRRAPRPSLQPLKAPSPALA